MKDKHGKEITNYDIQKEMWERCINKQKPCEMTTEEYRQRMIQVFQNANCEELIALCVLPTEKEFEHLEWLLKRRYKKEPCEKIDSAIKEMKALADPRNTILGFDEKMGLKVAINILLRNSGYAPDTNVGSKKQAEPCEDAVSRQAVSDFLGNHAKDFEDAKTRMAFKAASSLVKNADNVPPVTPTRKKGKWIIDNVEVKAGRIWHCHCSECKKDPQGYIGGSENWWVVRLPKYCPYCGCLMEGEE